MLFLQRKYFICKADNYLNYRTDFIYWNLIVFFID